MPGVPRERAEWTVGPAKTGAAGLLGGAALVGLTWTIVERSPVTPPAPAHAAPSAPLTARTTPVDEASEDDQEPASRPDPPTPEPSTGEGPSLTGAWDPEGPADAPSIALRVRVNTAPAAELELLPGIGPVLAQRIVDDRAHNGAYRSIEDLRRVRGIGVKTANALAPHLRFD